MRHPQLTELAYNPDQPREPAGSDRGGEWTDGGGAGKNEAEDLEYLLSSAKKPEITMGITRAQMSRDVNKLRISGEIPKEFTYAYVSPNRPADQISLGLGMARGNYLLTKAPLSFEKIKSLQLSPLGNEFANVFDKLAFAGAEIEVGNKTFRITKALQSEGHLRLTRFNESGEPEGHVTLTPDRKFKSDVDELIGGKVFDARPKKKQGMSADDLTPSHLQMHRFQLSFPIQGAIDRETSVIRGVSVITEGAAKGHKLQIDARTLSQVRDTASAFLGGLKVKMNHGTGADAIIGALRAFRVDGQQLRADLHLLKSSPMRDRVIEMAAEMPDSFGLSITFTGTPEELDGNRHARCLEIYSCDIVDQPAANPTGLFSAIDTNQNTKAMIIETPEYLELQATHKAAIDRFQKLDADFQTVTKERTELTAKLSEAQTKLTALETAHTELKASSEKATAEHAAALADFTAKVELAASQKMASLGAAPVALGKDSVAGTSASSKELVTQLEAITDPTEKIRFYRKNKDGIDAAFRA